MNAVLFDGVNPQNCIGCKGRSEIGFFESLSAGDGQCSCYVRMIEAVTMRLLRQHQETS
jgi:hypothetical protein